VAALAGSLIGDSNDERLTWRHAMTLDDGATPVDPAVPLLTGGVSEFSYTSAVLVGPELLVTYTWQRAGSRPERPGRRRASGVAV
jgi:hypothetical protein